MDNLQSVIDAAVASAAPTTLHTNDQAIIAYVPRGHNGHGEVVTIDLTPYRATPARKQGTITVYDPDSFLRVLEDNKDAGERVIFVDESPDRPGIMAILNSPGPSGPGYGDFKLKLEFRPTVQWRKWLAIDGKMMPQSDFAEFVEENLSDVQQPEGALIMEMITQLQATRTVGFKSSVRLQSGAYTFQHDEDVQAQVGPGQIAVPEAFTLALAPFFGVQPFAIKARFRYRLADRKLMLGLKLQRVEDVIATVVKEMVTEIAAPEGVPVLYGPVR